MTKLKLKVSGIKERKDGYGRHFMNVIATKSVDNKQKCKNCKILERAEGSSRCKPCSGLYKLKGKKNK